MITESAGDLMAGFVAGLDRGQATLVPECLEDWVHESNSVRAVDVFVEALDLRDLTEEYRRKTSPVVRTTVFSCQPSGSAKSPNVVMGAALLLTRRHHCRSGSFNRRGRHHRNSVGLHSSSRPEIHTEERCHTDQRDG